MPRIISRTFHSLVARSALLLMVLAGLIVAVLLTSWLVFQKIDTQMTVLKAERMPELEGSSNVIAATDATRGLLTSTLFAHDQAALEIQAKAAQDIFANFNAAVASLSPATAASMRPTLEETKVAVSDLLEARSQEFAVSAAMIQAIQSAATSAEMTSILIEEANDNAFFDMTLNSEDSIATIDETLTRLVDDNFGQFQAALAIRGETNLIAGLAIAYSQDSRSNISTIIADLAASSIDRLEHLLEQAQNIPAFAEVVPTTENAISTFRTVFKSGVSSRNQSEVLSARLAVDTVLSPALDDIYFDLVIASDEAKDTNQAALKELVEGGVESMRVNASLDAATKYYFTLLLQVSSAQSIAELDLRQSDLSALAENILRLKADTEFDQQADLIALLALADSETGLRAKRLLVLDARSAALSAAQDATLAVDAIAAETSRFSETVFTKIEDTAEYLAQSVDGARAQLVNIAYIALAIVMIVPVFLWIYITRPISRVTAVTERLAGGDLSEITGLPANQGELGRMSLALHVFRNKALDAIKMQQEERERERALLEAERTLEQTRLQDERQRATEKAERQRLEREQEAQRDAETKERQQLEMADRIARMEEQAIVVDDLAQGLKKLASGDLTFHIQRDFPEAYKALRNDYNAAIENLAQIVHQLKGCSHTIEGNCMEIAEASTDLARRAETNASTLAETAASVDLLTQSVTEAAQSADDANNTLQHVRKQAKINHDIMNQAKSAMEQVETASEKITSIVDIIDSVAFQTNLLALNAGIEAARAGKAGQGFAVVASEVRTLAQRCSQAASEVSSVVEESTRTVRKGVELAVNANSAMGEINLGIDQISQIVESLTKSATGQAISLKEINLSVQNLEQSTQHNAAMFEETSASNHLLNSEALALSQIVKSFSIGEIAQIEAHNSDTRIAS
ncbi:methyl-accepting chemotaxis protein [Pacificibacter maritimus]|uniref:Methyl-accepting chemotaxis protein n=1 Tax=Pacificibacter maritimus TaxID=762213 RepID=A0A3N4TYL8_9RHOB|nr:methyl-accepting chemotaxis protein [Pacificibacter maritimus]RPE62918.1 methyl-accepting chemotaxis protein [Pacificibacter maritimus]